MENSMASETHRPDFIRTERPRLSALAAKVARVHGGRHPELEVLASWVNRLFVELESHPEKAPSEAGKILAGIRLLTSGYRTPEDACNSYLALFQGLERLDAEMPGHIRQPAPVPPEKGGAAGCGEGTGSCCSL